jgi:integrase
MESGGPCRALLILGRRGPAPRTHSRTASGCLSRFASCCWTCLQRQCAEICAKLGVREKVTPHDLRRTFCSKVTALGFGRDAMNRVTNHKEGGIADVYDRHRYQEENKKIMEAVARHIVTVAEHGGPANVVALGARR